MSRVRLVSAIVALAIAAIVAGVTMPSAGATYEDPPTVPCDQQYIHVIDSPAYDEVVPEVPAIPGAWSNFAPNLPPGEPYVGPPSWPTDPGGTWEGPHTDGGPQQDAVGVFQQGSGNASWFHRDAGTPAVPSYVIHHDEVSHDKLNPDYPCDEPPTPVAFAFSDVTPPTCDDVGSFLQASFPGVTVTIDPPLDGPGTYTVTATLDDPDAVWADIGGNEPRSRTITVDGALGFQSDDPSADCYVAPPPPPPPPTVPPTIPPTHITTPPALHVVPTCADDPTQAGCVIDTLPRTGVNWLLPVALIGGALIAAGATVLALRRGHIG